MASYHGSFSDAVQESELESWFCATFQWTEAEFNKFAHRIHVNFPPWTEPTKCVDRKSSDYSRWLFPWSPNSKRMKQEEGGREGGTGGAALHMQYGDHSHADGVCLAPSSVGRRRSENCCRFPRGRRNAICAPPRHFDPWENGSLCEPPPLPPPPPDPGKEGMVPAAGSSKLNILKQTCPWFNLKRNTRFSCDFLT